MSVLLNFYAFVALCLCGFLTASASQGATQYIQPAKEDIGLLATVNGIPITILDVLETTAPEENRLSSMYKGAEFKRELEKLRKDALENVINRKLAYEEFKTFRIKLPRDFVEDNLDRIMKTFNVNTRQELEKLLKSYGQNLPEFKDKAYENVAVDSLLYDKCFRNAYVSPKKVYDYYEAHKNDFVSPAEYNLSVLSLKTEGIHKADLEPLTEHLISSLSDNQQKSFEDAVSLYSDGPNVDKNGNIGWINLSTLRKDFTDILINPKKDHVYGPIKSKEAYYFIRINDVKPSVTQSFEQVSQEITEQLLNKQREENYKKYVESLRSRAYIIYYVNPE